jgi:VanZ family protein
MWGPASTGPRLAVAAAATLAVLIGAPVIGQIRGAIQDALPGQYRAILIGIVLLAVGGAIAWAAVTIRSRRRLRYGLIALAVGIAAVYATAMATGNANVDAVERFHFIEYGLLTVLFHRAWSGRGGLAAILLPFMAVFIAGTLDEAIQWFVPARVGEWRDVLLNGVAITCGLLFGAALEPPDVVHLTDDLGGTRPQADDAGGVRLQADRRLLATMALLAVLTFAAFFSAVHLGHEIHDPAIGSFRSRYDAGALLAMSADRARRWKTDPPATLRRFSREDQYLAEALWHIQRRNDIESEGGLWATWKENLILEKYFAPVLDIPTFATPGGARWPPAQRENVAAAVAGAGERTFVSDAHPFPIYAWFDR